jgi:hypothetical protein
MATITVTPTQTFVSGNTVTPATLNQLAQSTVALTAGTVVDADVSASAAIALSKLATGALPTAITVASANLVDGTIVNADINATAAIAGSKLADAGITAAKLDGAQTGDAPIYGCRAWVLFDGTKDTTGAASTANTNRQILASGNVSSVTRTAAGTYTVNFTTAMSDANFAAFATCSSFSSVARNFASGVSNRATSSVSAHIESSDGTPTDQDDFSVCVFR